MPRLGMPDQRARSIPQCRIVTWCWRRSMTVICPRLFLVTLMLIVSAAAAGQSVPAYPSRPIRLVVAQSAGGSADFVARSYAQRLTGQLGQQIVIDNRAGGAGVVGTEVVVHAQPDGYTLLLAPTSHAINPYFVAKLPYDTRRDLASISLTSAGYNLLVVNPSA